MFEKFNISDIYHGQFLSLIVPIFDVISLMTALLTVILIGIIMAKTPKQMLNFKTYLIPYSCITLILGICLGFCAPIWIHPFPCFYPVGAVKYLPPIFSKILLILVFNLAMALMDSCTAMSLERYFAMQNLPSSKIPFRIYSFLLFTDLALFGFMLFAVTHSSFENTFFLSKKNAEIFLHQNFNDYSILDPNYLIVFTNAAKNYIPMVLIYLSLIAIPHLIFALIMLFLNIQISRNPQFVALSKRLQQSNEMLLRMTFIQFFGMSTLYGFSVICVTLYFLFVPYSSNIPNFCLVLLNFYGLFDILTTIIFIHPYRNFFVEMFKKVFCWNLKVSVFNK